MNNSSICKNGWVKYYHNKDLLGKIFYAWQEEDNCKNNSETNKPMKFIFHIEYKTNKGEMVGDWEISLESNDPASDFSYNYNWVTYFQDYS